jgi:hypothetical protein
MTELWPPDLPGTYLIPLILVVALLALWLVQRRKAQRPLSLSAVLDNVAFERVEGIIIPDADDGEIQIDYLLLTPQGLLIIHLKDVVGAVFGSDKMQDWTVIGTNRRFTFGNPQPALYDRIAAVRHIVRQVPVTGRILFLDGAEFTKGVPGLVCNLQQLLDEFGEPDKSAANFKVEAFRSHWQKLMEHAIAPH